MFVKRYSGQRGNANLVKKEMPRHQPVLARGVHLCISTPVVKSHYFAMTAAYAGLSATCPAVDIHGGCRRGQQQISLVCYCIQEADVLERIL
jgi:acetyl-CoA acetyltransferase